MRLGGAEASPSFMRTVLVCSSAVFLVLIALDRWVLMTIKG